MPHEPRVRTTEVFRHSSEVFYSILWPAHPFITNLLVGVDCNPGVRARHAVDRTFDGYDEYAGGDLVKWCLVNARTIRHYRDSLGCPCDGGPGYGSPR